MAIVKLVNALAFGANGGTTAARDTTGATLIVIGCMEGFSASLTLSDSQSNTWLTAPPTRYSIFGQGVQIQYALCAGKTSATHTFSYSNTSAYGVIDMVAFSGAAAASPFDQENGLFNNNTQPGSITPTENDEVVVSIFSWTVTGTTVTSVTGMTLLDQQDVGVSYGGAMAYVIQTSAAAIDPTWNYTGSPGLYGTSQASFKAAAGGGGGNPWYAYSQMQ